MFPVKLENIGADQQKIHLKEKRFQCRLILICVASKSQEEVPDSNLRAMLQMAGLGEKKISMPECSDGYNIHSELTANFPKLKVSGGYDLLRLQEGGGKQLDIIACPQSGYSVSFLKAVIHCTKIFIRPLQKDLPLDVIDDNCACIPKELCLQCGKEVFITYLKKHFVQCSGSKFEDTSNLAVSLIEPTLPPLQSNASSPLEPILSPPMQSFPLESTLSPLQSNVSSPLEPDILEPTASSIVEFPLSGVDSEPKSIVDNISQLKKGTCSGSFDLIVRRKYVLADCYKRMDNVSFRPDKSFKVVFVEEDGADTGD